MSVNPLPVIDHLMTKIRCNLTSDSIIQDNAQK